VAIKKGRAARSALIVSTCSAVTAQNSGAQPRSRSMLGHLRGIFSAAARVDSGEAVT
jgi:hypothetical protein